MKTLSLAKSLALPLDYVTSRNMVLAQSGAGKSNVCVVLAEEMHRNGIPWIAIDTKGDWYGVRSSSSTSRLSEEACTSQTGNASSSRARKSSSMRCLRSRKHNARRSQRCGTRSTFESEPRRKRRRRICSRSCLLNGRRSNGRELRR